MNVRFSFTRSTFRILYYEFPLLFCNPFGPNSSFTLRQILVSRLHFYHSFSLASGQQTPPPRLRFVDCEKCSFERGHVIYLVPLPWVPHRCSPQTYPAT